MKSYSVQVPCKTYIRKYFCGLYGIIGNTIALNNQFEFGDVILTKLSSDKIKVPGKNLLKIYCEPLDDSIRFQLPMDLFYRLPRTPSREHFYIINRYLYNTFENDLHSVICMGNIFSIPKLKIIRAFCDRYDISPEDIDIESLRKKYYRFSKSPTAQNFFLASLSQPLHSFDLNR